MLSCTISGGKTRKTYTPRWSTDSQEKPRRIDEEEENEDAEFEEEQLKKRNHSQDHHQQQQQEEGEPGIDKTTSTPMEWWLEDICMLDMDYFVRTIAAIRSKGVRPQLVGTIISHYAIKWLPGLVHQQNRFSTSMLLQNQSISKANEDTDGGSSSSSDGMMTAHRKNRIVLETLIRILPAEKDALSCSFLLRLLRMATIVGTCDVYRAELERRIGMDLESATLPDLLIPSFSHNQHTIFDVQLVHRILGYFINRFRSNNNSSGCGVRVPNSMIQVAKLLDGYLAEIALDANLDFASFETLAACMPSHARVCDDGLYRAIDTYLKAHPGITDDERKSLCKLMDCYKLSFDACMHASQNERLPVRTVLQVLFCEHAKLRNSCFCRKNPDDNEEDDGTQGRPRQNGSSLDLPALQQQVRKLSEDMAKVQLLCDSIQRHMEKTCRQHQHQRKNGGSDNGGGGFAWMSFHSLRKIARKSAQLGRAVTTFQKDRQKESDSLSQLEEEGHRRHQQQPVMGNQQHDPPPPHAAAESMPLDEGPWRRFSAS